MTKEEQFVNELIGYIFAYPDDDYMTMECLCRKLHKYGLIAKVDGHYEPKDEPQIEPNLIFPERMERGEMYEVGDSIVVMNSEDYYDLLCKSWEKDEPQIIACPINERAEYWFYEDEPQTDYGDYERAVEQMQHDMRYEPTYNAEDGSM